MDAPEGPRADRAKARKQQELLQEYLQFLASRRVERSPEMAHQFALEMRHKGIPLGQSVAELVMAYEGRLPAYWPK